MRAIFLKKFGNASAAFDLLEISKPIPKMGEVLIKVEGFGLNYADVMARLGLYDDCPKLPGILGYDVVGIIEQVGENIGNFKVGDRVLALTRFGGYAEYAVADARVIALIGSEVSIADATALATQLSTAYYAAYEAVNLFEGDIVLVHAAAGGVGNGIVQLCKLKGCKVIATAGSDAKIEVLKSLGVDYPINYKKDNYVNKIKELGLHKKVDVVFDSIAGDNIGKGFKMLNAGGRLVIYGASKLSESPNKLMVIKNALQFGIYHPAEFMMSSRSIIGVNMLRIADNKPSIIQRCMTQVVELYNTNKIKLIPGSEFSLDELSIAHSALESRSTTGKLAIKW